jgi:MFS family permease
MRTERTSSAPAQGASRWLNYENRTLAILCLSFGFVFFDRNAVNFLAPYFMEDLALSNTQIGLLASGLSLTWAASGYFGGRICDAIGRHRLILTLAVVGFSLCSFLSALAGSFIALLAARILMGLSEGPILPISQVVMVQASSPKRRGFNMGAMQQFGANVLGTFIAPVALVALATHYGWRSAFFVAGVPGLFCALLIWRYVRDPARNHASDQVTQALGLREVLAYRNIPLCMMISGLMIAMAVLAWVFYPLYFTQVLHISPAKMSVLMSVLGLSAVISSLVVPGLSDRYGRKPVMIVTMLVALLMPASMVYATQSDLALGAMLFAGFAASSLAPLAMATIPAETIGGLRVTAVVGLVNGAGEILGGVLSPAAGGYLADRFGLIAPIALQTGCILLTIVLIAFLHETAPGRRPALSNASA